MPGYEHAVSLLHHQRRAGVATPPAAKLTTGKRPSFRRLLHQIDRRADFASIGVRSSSFIPWMRRISPITARAWRTA